MEKEYKIKGIEKILEKVDKKDLVKYYGIDNDNDIEKAITQSFQSMGIPNNSEIGIYVTLTKKEYDKRRKEGKSTSAQDIASEFYENDERKRAMYGINYDVKNNQIDIDDSNTFDGIRENVLYFVIDKPIKASAIENILGVHYFVGGCNYHNLIMGTAFYEEHKDELDQYSINNDEKLEAVDKYIENFMNEYEDVEFTGGCGPRPKYEETDEIKMEKANNEKIILNLTGKNSIDEVSLRDFINLKRRLEKEQKELKETFAKKFTEQNYDERN